MSINGSPSLLLNAGFIEYESLSNWVISLKALITTRMKDYIRHPARFFISIMVIAFKQPWVGRTMIEVTDGVAVDLRLQDSVPIKFPRAEMIQIDPSIE